jgi:hypothetical protein
MKACLTAQQEFSIEIPDKEADAIHSGMFSQATSEVCVLTLLQ